MEFLGLLLSQKFTEFRRNFTENSEFFHDPRCLHCVLCSVRAGGIRPSLSSSFEVQAGNAQVLTVLAAAAAAAQ